MICKTTMVAWLASMMMSWIKPSIILETRDDSRLAETTAISSVNLETREEMYERFTSIANDAVDTVQESGNVFYGDYAVLRSAWAILGVAHHETRWAKEVDVWTHEGTGVIKDGAWCLMQIQLGKKKTYLDDDNKTYRMDSHNKTAEGWTGRDLVDDRKKCFKVGYRMIKQSFGACRHKPMELHMAAYASGSCERGHTRSRELVNEMLGLSRIPPKELKACTAEVK